MLPDFKHANGMLELLIGAAGGRFPMLHYDVHHLHAFVTQVRGEKEFVLYAPDQGRFLYPGDGARQNISAIPNVFDVDLARFPLFADAESVRAIVVPGETIFVPAGWWHATRMITDSIAVSLNTVSASNWRSFSRDVCAATRRWKRPLKSAVLLLLGAVLDGTERL